MSSTARHKVGQTLREALRGRFTRMDPEDRVALLEIAESLRAAPEADVEEILDAFFEILFPESILEEGDLEEPEDIQARRRVDAHRAKLGKAILDLRLERGLTQEQLASASGLPQSHISRLENGKHTATHLTIERIASALEVEPGRLDPGLD